MTVPQTDQELMFPLPVGTVPQSPYHATLGESSGADGTIRTLGWASIIGLLRRNGAWIALVVVLVTAVMGVVLARLPPVYQAEAILAVLSEQPAMQFDGANSTGPGTAVTDADVASHVDAVTSGFVLEDAGRRLDIDHDPAFTDPADYANGTGIFAPLRGATQQAYEQLRAFLSPHAFVDRHLTALSRLRKSVHVWVESSSHNIVVQAVAKDPRRAVEIANTIARATIAYSLAMQTEHTQRLESWLGARGSRNSRTGLRATTRSLWLLRSGVRQIWIWPAFCEIVVGVLRCVF